MYEFIRHNIWFQMFQKGKILKIKVSKKKLPVSYLWFACYKIQFTQPKLLTSTKADQIPIEIHETKNELFQKINFHRRTTEKHQFEIFPNLICLFSNFQKKM